MTKDEIKQILVLTVTERQGLKATELMSEFLEFLSPEQRHEVLHKGIDNTGQLNFIDLIDELIKEGSLVEVEYSLPAMSYRLKSFLLPKGTKIHRISK